MDGHEESEYQRLSKMTRLEPMNLEEELISLPQYVQEVNDHVAAALFRRDMLKHEHERQTAKSARSIRENAEKKPSDATIAMEVLLDPEVQRLQEELEVARFDATLWTGLANAFTTKSSMAKRYSELTVAGFLAPNAAYKERRDELNARRQERGRTRRPINEEAT